MRTTGPAAVLLVVALAVAGCGEDAPEASDDTGTGGGAATIQVEESSLGEVLTDGDGRTLYLFTQDSEGSSSCEDDCLAAWPPLEGEPSAGDGVDDGLIGTIARSDGSTQATYNGHPLYYYAEDSDAGDVNGQGVDDVWWAVDGAGAAVETPAEEPEESDDTGGNYDY